MSEKTNVENFENNLWKVTKKNITEIRERRNVKPEIMTEERRKELDERWKKTSRKPRTY